MIDQEICPTCAGNSKVRSRTIEESGLHLVHELLHLWWNYLEQPVRISNAK